MSASAGSIPIMLRNASVGKRSANPVTKSHPPVGATSSTRRRQRSRSRGSAASTARGANHGLRMRRYWMWSGGSTCVGTNR